MLAEDDAEERKTKRIGQALDVAVAVTADVRILRRKGDEATFGQATGVGVVVLVINGWIGDILRATLQTMLTDDDRALFTWTDALRHEQNAVGEDVLCRTLPAVDVEPDLVATKGGGVVDEAAAWAQGAP